MQNDTSIFGIRDKSVDRTRLGVLVIILLVLASIEFTFGPIVKWWYAGELDVSGSKWAQANYKASEGYIKVPEKQGHRKRLLYISNSHAKTGGDISNHLQGLLDIVVPGQYEVLDMAEPGIFAPDMLQRVLAGLEYDPDIIVLGVAYISFSDRMRLSQQAHSVRSFFREDVFGKLSTGFWLRHYDLGLYGDTLVANNLGLYKYRNQIRNMWEKPVAHFLKGKTSNRPIIFLEVDENQRWKFPDGYDNNLFQWRLYAAGREKHLEDLRDLVEVAHKENVPLLAFNAPIHWEKSVYQYDSDDYQLYQDSLRKIFSDVLEYVDYQNGFPKEFTTYDALHPTWHGARLHALDIVLRLSKNGKLDTKLTASGIVKRYLAMDAAVSESYLSGLDGNYPRLSRLNFRRYDIGEPENARHLMRRLASFPVGSRQEQVFLYELSLRILYFRDSDFVFDQMSMKNYSSYFYKAITVEMEKARKRIDFFSKKLNEFQGKRLSRMQVPFVEDLPIIKKEILHYKGNLKLIRYSYRVPDENIVKKITTTDNKVVAYIVPGKPGGHGYKRVDILGDGSFLLLQSGDARLILPSWVKHSSPFVRFGV